MQCLGAEGVPSRAKWESCDSSVTCMANCKKPKTGRGIRIGGLTNLQRHYVHMHNNGAQIANKMANKIG